MNRITVRVPDDMMHALDAAASELKLSRTEIIHDAMERYLEDHDDIALAQERLEDPTDQVISWHQAKHELLDSD